MERPANGQKLNPAKIRRFPAEMTPMTTVLKKIERNPRRQLTTSQKPYERQFPPRRDGLFVPEETVIWEQFAAMPERDIARITQWDFCGTKLSPAFFKRRVKL